ncbi:MAG: YybH family protein, partial [bacterium]
LLGVIERLFEKMQRLRLFFLVVVISPFVIACDRSSIDVEAEKAALTDRGSALLAAEAARDLEAVMTYWSDEATLQVNGTPQINGKDAVREVMRGMLTSFKEFGGSTTHIELSASGDMAYEYGINRVVLPGEETELLAMGKYLVVWKRIGGTWLISALSVTNDDPEPAPMTASQNDA